MQFVMINPDLRSYHWFSDEIEPARGLVLIQCGVQSRAHSVFLAELFDHHRFLSHRNVVLLMSVDGVLALATTVLYQLRCIHIQLISPYHGDHSFLFLPKS